MKGTLKGLAAAAAVAVALMSAACTGEDEPTSANPQTPSPTAGVTTLATASTTAQVPTTQAPPPPGNGFSINGFDQSEVVARQEGALAVGGTVTFTTPALPHVWGVGYEWYDCQKTVGVEGFAGITFGLKLGPNGRNGTQFHREEQGDGYQRGNTLPAELKNTTNTYDVRVSSEAGCKFILYFVAKNKATTANNLGAQVMTMQGQDDDNIDVPSVHATWRVAWEYDCNGSTDSFVLADSGLLDLANSNHIVEKYETTNKGVFTQDDARADGERTLTVVTGATCTWKITIYQQ